MQSSIDSTEERKKIILTLFIAFGEAGDGKRIALYSKVLEGFPNAMLKKACHKIMLENKFMPKIAEIVSAINSLAGTLDDGKRERTWEEAWTEIQTAVRHIGAYRKQPKFSRAEIDQAVLAFGWYDLCTLQSTEVNTARAQMRRLYEDACNRHTECQHNNYVLAGANQRLAGGFSCAADVLLGINGAENSPIRVVGKN